MAITIYELERRVTSVEQSFQRIQEQLDRSEKLFENFMVYVYSCFEEIFQRLSGHDQHFVSIDQRFERVDQRLAKIETNMVTHADLAAVESRLKDFILAAFQKSSQ